MWRFDALLWQAGGDDPHPRRASRRRSTPRPASRRRRCSSRWRPVDHSVYLDNGNGNYANLFNSGKIGMLFTGPWDLSGFPDVDYGVQILPGDQNHQTISGPDQWVMFDNGDDAAQRRVDVPQVVHVARPRRSQWSLATGDLPDPRVADPARRRIQKYTAKYPGIATFVDNLQQRDSRRAR